MRVIECNLCGEVVQADDDAALREAVAAHLADQHAGAGMDEDQVRGLVERNAYDAMDA
ncbi:MAG TPA: hypothetical protein VNB64_05570 [Solirubrobacteraceae bacterium]|nr:hypothetical protein [Solirubrobacteraceae bacterium]